MPAWLLMAQAACAAPPGFATLPLAKSRPSPAVRAAVATPAPPQESSSQPPAPFTMGQAREQRADAAGGPAATVTQSVPAVSAMAPDEPRVSTLVAFHSGTATVALPDPTGEGVPSSEQNGLCSYLGFGENLRAVCTCSSEDTLTSTACQPGYMATSALLH